MAWRSGGRTNAELITNLKRNGIFHSDRVMEVRSFRGPNHRNLTLFPQAMHKVDRSKYVLYKEDAYEDSPQFVLCAAVPFTEMVFITKF